MPDQPVRQLICRRIQLRVRQGPALPGERPGVRGAGDLGGEQLRNAPGRCGRRGQDRAVAERVEVRLFGVVDQTHRRQRPLWVGGHRCQQQLHPVDQGRNGFGVEHVGPEFDLAADAGGLPCRSPTFGQRESQVHTGGLGTQGDRRDVDALQPRTGGRIGQPGEVLPGQHDLHQRMVGEAPCGVEPLDQYLEWHILVLEGLQTAGPDLVQQVGDRRVAGQVGTQHEGVDEEADEIVESGITPAGDREAHGDISIRTDLRERRQQCGLDDHEGGRVVLPGEPGHLLLQLGRPLDGHRRTGHVGDQRVGPIRGQLHALGQPGQRVLPVRQLRGHPATAVVEPAELCPLPQRVVDVLHRQRGPVRCLTGAPAGVGQTQIGDQRSQ